MVAAKSAKMAEGGRELKGRSRFVVGEEVDGVGTEEPGQERVGAEEEGKVCSIVEARVVAQSAQQRAFFPGRGDDGKVWVLGVGLLQAERMLRVAGTV